MTKEEKLQAACDALLQRLNALTVENVNLQVDMIELREQLASAKAEQPAPAGET